MADPDFWGDQQKAQTIINEANALKDYVNTYNKLSESHEELQMTHDLLKEDPDQDLQNELVSELKSLTKQFNEFELQLLLSEPYDKNNAILELHPGAGGTESQDWGSMLLRMYTRWAERRGFKVETLDYLPGDEAGIKSVTLLIKGHNAYGYLKAEKGVHRLVRISPFDSSGRRHTSFVSCDVMPEFNEEIDIEIRTEDIKVDTYRSSGAGGQHVNTTDSAVRITHLPTGIIATSSEKSQIQNREKAMKVLKARLFDMKLQEEQQKYAAQRKSAVGSGDRSERIRTYNYPQSRVTDHRIGLTLQKLDQIMEGKLDEVIDALTVSEQTEKLKELNNGEL